MNLYKREKYLKRIRPFYKDDDIIKVITGVRRCGKSSLMKTIIEELKNSGVKESNIIYIDLDKKGNRKIDTPDKLEKLIDSLDHKSKSLKYLFIDEVQNVKDYERLINGYRTDGGYSIFITGSNSYLLSGELMTKLTGRYVEFEIYPLTFEEYEEMKFLYKKKIDNDRNKELVNYILDGGFPRTILIDEKDAKREYVTSIVNEIFKKDIKSRLKIKNVENFNLVKNYIINNFGSTTSIKSIEDGLKNDGIKITRATINKYIEALKDAKIIYECDRFDMKSKRSLKNEKKYYLCDLSFYFVSNTDNRINFGPVLENIVYFYARSYNYSLSVGRIGKLECDFITRNNNMDYSYIQVAYSIYNPSDKELEDKLQTREYRSLLQSKDNYNKYIMTLDYLLQKKDGIRHINLIDFMLDKKQFN